MSKSSFTDIFIRRPVLACVVSLLIFFLGLRALIDLNVRQYPKMENTVITVTTAYPGASGKLMEGFITTPLEKAVAGASGLDYVTSASIDNISQIKAFVKLNYDPNTAFTNVMSKVAEVRGELPKESEAPVIQKETGSQIALMYIAFNSKEMTAAQITDYISRVVQPKIETTPGVAEAKILGGSQFAMRVWLNPKRMAALSITPTEVASALLRNNFQSAAGKTKGEYIAIPINAKTDVENVEGFNDIIIKQTSEVVVRLKDVARIQLGQESYDSSVIFNGKKAVFIGVSATPSANPLTVIAGVKHLLPQLEKNYPPTLTSKIVYDATEYIRASIHEVVQTIAEATVIVILVIFLFLGSIRTVLVPVVTIPLSLIGVCAIMLALGYSLNLLTLLAMVLAIGMVVDDAIVVVENIYRHIEEGMSPLDAALKGAREIAMPIVSMTITLAAVYAPIGFMGGLTGALFTEFAFTLASAVIVSGVIALTLSPMMCSRLLTRDIGKGRLVHFIDTAFDKLKHRYQRSLHGSLDARPVTIVFAFVVLVSCVFLYATSKAELAPQEDQGVLFVVATGPQYANIHYTEKFTQAFNAIYQSFSSLEDYFIINGFDTVNNVISGFMMKPWNKRHQTQQQLLPLLQQKLGNVAGLQVQAFPLPPLPTSGNSLPVEFIVASTDSYDQIYEASEKILQAAQRSGLFLYIANSLKFNKPELELTINRAKAALLGVDMQSIGQALSTSFGENYVNRFSLQGRSYKVIPQVGQQFRLNPQEIEQIYIRTENGTLVPFSSLATANITTRPNALTHFQQLNAVTLSGLMMPGDTLEQGLTFLQQQAKKYLPHSMNVDYAGQSRRYVEEGNVLLLTFIFSIIIIFLVLAAQFESFKDPLVIMLSVPMAICGALLPINLTTHLPPMWGIFSVTVNIYTQIGLITLIGLISKHGILMVDFANKLQLEQGLPAREAIEKAAAIRLRPILMTTAAMILGVVPLLMAAGAGAASRFDIGMVIASGMAIGTLFTLYVVPAMYTLKAKQILLFLAGVAGVIFLLYYCI